jgi:hypothetical protein
MNRYAQLSGGVVHQVIESETQPDAAHGIWIACGNAGPGWAYDGTTFAAPPPPAPPVVTSVTMRQARLALLDAGKLSSVQPAINSLPDPAKTRAQIEWDYSNEVHRNEPFVLTLGAALGLDTAGLDALFAHAAML